MLLDTRAIVLFPEIIGHQVDTRGFGRFPAERSAHRILFATVNLGVVEQILGIAVALLEIAGDARGKGFPQRDVDHALDLVSIEIAIFAVGRGAKPIHVGFGRDEVDHTGGGVASK